MKTLDLALVATPIATAVLLALGANFMTAQEIRTPCEQGTNQSAEASRECGSLQSLGDDSATANISNSDLIYQSNAIAAVDSVPAQRKE